ncbi:MAG: hypothetical protein ABI877_10535 [Gemmatimonadaceae bacterium]
MDFIERIFHLAPDGGNGGYEVLLLVLPLLVGFVMRLRRARRG